MRKKELPEPEQMHQYGGPVPDRQAKLMGWGSPRRRELDVGEGKAGGRCTYMVDPPPTVIRGVWLGRSGSMEGRCTYMVDPLPWLRELLGAREL